MLDREILKTDYGVSYGSVTLKSLQNDNVPELDLLVREAIQNSSDASLNEKSKSYAVNFTTGVFNPKVFNQYLSGLEKTLNSRYPDPTASFLEIRDTKTCGLTGSLRKNEIKKDDHGNFFKLIYDTGKRQTITTAGGNWGFGKSVYYRVGIGIVVFYSRIKEGKTYEERMIITLVEDESKTETDGSDATLLNSIEPLSAGKAWWGIRENDDLLPLQDSSSIKKILDIFGINSFKEGETGTSIIIPYINVEELLNGIIPVEADIEEGVKKSFLSTWASSISDYLRLSIQKWYAPKIHNRDLSDITAGNNKWLHVSVDNKPIRKQDMLPFFKLAQELYTTALARTYSCEYSSKDYPQIVTLPVNIMSYFECGQTAGYVSLIRVSKDELGGSAASFSPYDYIGKFEADGGLNEPIVMCARDPGMVIDYAITGPWVKNIAPPESEDEFFFAFFVPVTNNVIKHTLQVPEYAGMSLGEYLRECEASDHMCWNDPVKMQIVQRIQRNTINQINKQFKSEEKTAIAATASKLSSRLGKNLLPKVGYGKTKAGTGSGSGGSGTKLTNVSLMITSQTIHQNEITMDYVIKLSHGKKHVVLSMMTASEAGWIDANAWENDIGTSYPVEMKEIDVESVRIPVTDELIELGEKCTKDNKEFDSEILKVSLQSETQRNILTQVLFESNVQNPEIHGRIRLYSYDKKYQYSIRVE